MIDKITPAGLKKLYRSLLHDVAISRLDDKIVEYAEENGYTQREMNTRADLALIPKLLLHMLALELLAEVDQAIINIRSKSFGTKQIAKVFWQNWYALTQSNSDLARYHELDTMRLSYILALGIVEHRTEFKSPFAATVRKRTKRNAILFARRDTAFERHHREVKQTREDKEFQLYNWEKEYKRDVIESPQYTSVGKPTRI